MTMCELLAMSARFPTTVHLSMAELARHGGDTGPHRDGWGVGFVEQGDAFVLREPAAASGSPWLAFLQGHALRSEIVIAHIRRATQGERLLRNSQPFARELGGRVHLFGHNGMLPGIEADPRFATRRFRRIGDTDSEHAFCALLERLAPAWDRGVPTIDERLDQLEGFAEELRGLGPANFVYSDGDAVFAHAHRRRDDTGEIRPPGLHLLCRHCAPADDGVVLAGLSMPEAPQEIALVASVPLSAEAWRPLPEGTIVVLREGRVVSTTSAAAGHGRAHRSTVLV
jgi:glutamine amidotransferase